MHSAKVKQCAVGDDKTTHSSLFDALHDLGHIFPKERLSAPSNLDISHPHLCSFVYYPHILLQRELLTQWHLTGMTPGDTGRTPKVAAVGRPEFEHEGFPFTSMERLKDAGQQLLTVKHQAHLLEEGYAHPRVSALSPLSTGIPSPRIV